MEEKLKCSKCGSENLQFVSFTKSKKDSSVFITVIGMLCVLPLFAFFMLIVSAGSVKGGLSLEGSILLGIVFILSSNTINLGIACYAYLKLLPYKIESEIHAVCTCCGHHENVEKILKENENAN